MAMERNEVAVVSGRSFMLSDGLGDIEPGTRLGLFEGDTRFLSCLRFTLNGVRPAELGGGPSASGRARFYSTNPELPEIPAGSLVIERERVLNGDLLERFAITNYGEGPAGLTLKVELAADFADVLELRSIPPSKLQPSTVAPPPRWHHAFGYRQGEFSCETLVRWSRTGRHEPGISEFELVLAPRETWRCQMRVQTTRESADLDGPQPASASNLFAPFRPTASVEAERGRTVLSDHALEALLNLIKARAWADLQSLVIELSTGERIVGAGLPYFMTLFGRDSVLTALQTLTLDPSLAANALIALARHQGVADDPDTDEEPGRIAHEVRDGELAFHGQKRHGCYYGTADATPLYLILYSEYLALTKDSELGDRLWPTAEAALDWIDNFGDADGDGFVEYRRRAGTGLDNQGWKDSWDSIAFADGRLAEGPIALCEVQGYVYDAKLRMSALYEQRGDSSRADELRASAERLRRHFEAAFWMPDQGTYALALDGRKQPVDAIASNAGHCLWSGLVSPERASLVAQRFSRADFFSGWGLRTLSTGMARYNPIGYHNGTVWPHDTVLAAEGFLRYGHAAPARRLLVALVEAAMQMPHHRLPELFAGSQRHRDEPPLAYPDANVPQAWAASATIRACELLADMSGLHRSLPTAEKRAASADRVQDQVLITD
jgi:glycogen debranching enzyme